jgi:hypothetical protein
MTQGFWGHPTEMSSLEIAIKGIVEWGKVWCGPADKFEQYRAQAMIGVVVSGSAITGGDQAL